MSKKARARPGSDSLRPSSQVLGSFSNDEGDSGTTPGKNDFTLPSNVATL